MLDLCMRGRAVTRAAAAAELRDLGGAGEPAAAAPGRGRERAQVGARPVPRPGARGRHPPRPDDDAAEATGG